MSYESTAQPIKLGYLMDFRLPEYFPQEMRDDLTRPFDLIFKEGLEQGIIDRPVEIVYREVEGLPKGTVKAVIDGYEELVDEGCLVIFGPSITDNAVPTREAIERRFRVPAVSVTGSEDWLGEWTFSFPMGSLTDEPIFWAQLLSKAGHTEVGVLVEQSLSARATQASCAAETQGSIVRRSGSRRPPDLPMAPSAPGADRASCTVVSAGILHVNRFSRRLAGTRPASRAPRSRTPDQSCDLECVPGWTGSTSTIRPSGRSAFPRSVRSGLRAASPILRTGRTSPPRPALPRRTSPSPAASRMPSSG